MGKILQFKITLSDSKPTIWRRFHIENTMMFYDLHLVIQQVMGWTNTHLYQFIYDENNFIGNPELLDSDDIANDKEITLSDIFDKPKLKMIYEYDFGDDWEHELVLEKIIDNNPSQQYPFCLEGAMNCPPEDCGGIYGFKDLMKKYKKTNHPDYPFILEWIGEDYDPNFFDVESVNENLKNYKDIDLGFN